MMVQFYSYFFLLGFSTTFYVDSYILTDGENNVLKKDRWEAKKREITQNDLLLNHKYVSSCENQIPQVDTSDEGNSGKKWSKIVTFDRLKNLTERDQGPENNTKVIFINSGDRLAIYENDYDDEEETEIQRPGNQDYGLLSPENFLTRIYSSEENSLERSKRQAEDGKKKCKCRRKGRRRRRRRRKRRRRVGQARPARRRSRNRRRGAGGRRRGRRRCVCRKKVAGEGGGKEGGEGEGEGGGEEEGEEEEEGKGNKSPEVEGEDGDEESTTTEGGGEEDEGKEGEEENEDDEEENGDESDENDEEDEKGGSDEESDEMKGKKPSGNMNHETPVYVISYPDMSGAHGAPPNTAGAPVYTKYPIPFSPYPYYTGSHLTFHEKVHHSSKM